MDNKSIFQVLSQCFDKDRCMDYVKGINSTDRWFNFAAFESTARYCADQMKKAGLEEVELLPLKADGRTPYGDWIIPKAWNATKGILKIVAPSVEDPILADYENIPCSLIMYSAPTPKGGVDAEVIVVDNAEGVNPDDVKGKLLFTSNKPHSVADLALKGGALGVISDFFPLYPGVRNNREEVYDTFRWENSFMEPVNNSGLVGFSLSPRCGDRLRELVSQASQKGEKVILHADVETEFYDGTAYTISGLLKGTDPGKEEIFVYGHLYEPGANDNASGCGAILEVACALKRAIDEGRLPRPRRSIRFAMGFECGGSMGYVQAHPDRIERTVAGLVADMVGSSPKDRTVMHIWHSPLSNWSYIDTLIDSLYNEYKEVFNEEYKIVDDNFNIGTDNILGDPIFGMPTLALIMHPALSYHSSMDTMDLVDPNVLKRNGIIMGSYLYIIASGDSDSIRWLLDEIEEHAENEMAKILSEDGAKAYLISRAFQNACLSLKKIADPGEREVLKAIDDAAKKLPVREMPEQYKECNENVMKNGGSLVPVRLVQGTLNFSQFTPEQKKQSKWHPAWNDALNIPLFWSDGKRNLWEVACLSAMELGKDNPVEYFGELKEYFEFLEKHGFIKLQ